MPQELSLHSTVEISLILEGSIQKEERSVQRAVGHSFSPIIFVSEILIEMRNSLHSPLPTKINDVYTVMENLSILEGCELI
jgi:hypothetical protein